MESPMYNIPMAPAGDYNNNNWNNNPFAYLIWIYALRWMGFNGQDVGGATKLDAVSANQIDNLRAMVGQIQADVACGNANGMRFLEQIANEARANGVAICDLGGKVCDAKTAVLGQLSQMQWQISNDTASVVNAINSCCCSTQSRIDALGCGIEKEILRQTSDLQQVAAANQAATQQGFNAISNGLANLGYAISQNDCNIRQLIASEGCATRQLMRDLHTEDIIATKDQTILGLQSKVAEYSQANLASTIIAALRPTTTTTTPTT